MDRNQLIRQEALLQLYGAGQRIGIRPSRMAQLARRQGDDFLEAEFEAACRFLVGQGFAEQVQSPVSGELRFRITSAGILEYENNR